MAFTLVSTQTIIARNAGALYGVEVGNANMNSYVTAAGSNTDAFLNTVYTNSVGNASTASVAAVLVAGLGITGDAATAATNYIVGQLNAVAVNARGAAINSMLSAFANMTSDATFGSFATAWNTQVNNAVAYAAVSGNGDASWSNVSATPAGLTFTLTTGADTGAAFTGGANNDTFNAAEATGGNATWTVGDAIDGGAGNDTFNVTQTAAITAPTGATVKNVETANLTSGTTGTSINTTSWTGLTALNISAPGAVTATAAATTAVSVTDSAQAAGAISVNGGSTVSTTATSSVASAGTGGTVTIGATTAAAGAVTVTESVSSTNVTNGTAATGGAIAVTGGTGITVTQNISGASVATANVTVNAVGGAVTVTGDANTTSATVNQTAAVVAVPSATVGVHGIKDGAVTINDKNAGSTTLAGVITTASVSNYGDSTINSNALTTVNLSGTGGTMSITTSSLTTPTNPTLALNVNGLSYKNTATDNAITVDSDVTTLNITSSTAASTVANLTASGATTVNVAGDAKLTLTNNTFAAATAINVTNTAGAVFGTTAIAAGTTFTGGAGADSIILSNAFTKAITMGDGNDTVTYGGAAGTGGSVAAGNGTDTIVMTDAQANTSAASGSSTFNSKFTGFEALKLSDALANTVDLDGINGATKVTLAAGANGGTISNLVSGGTVVYQANSAGATTVNVKSALVGTADVLNLVLDKTTGVLTAGSITAANVETVNIDATDTSTATGGSAANIHTATLVATSATSVVVTGNNGLNLTNTGNTAITSFDASDVVANGTAGTDTAANLGVTFASANTTASAVVTIKGGAGNDALTGNAAKDNITGGAGADTITGGTGQDTLNVGVGHDILIFNTNSDAQVLSSDSTTGAADIVNGFKKVGTAITTGVDFSSQANFIANAGGNTDLTILDVVMKVDDAGVGTGNAQAVTVQGTATGTGQAAGVTYAISSKGVLTLSGSGASSVNTLGAWLTEVNAAVSTTGKAVEFEFGGDTYVFAQNGSYDSLVQLVGVTGATGLVLASNSTTAAAGDILIASAF